MFKWFRSIKQARAADQKEEDEVLCNGVKLANEKFEWLTSKCIETCQPTAMLLFPPVSKT